MAIENEFAFEENIEPPEKHGAHMKTWNPNKTWLVAFSENMKILIPSWFWRKNKRLVIVFIKINTI